MINNLNFSEPTFIRLDKSQTPLYFIPDLEQDLLILKLVIGVGSTDSNIEGLAEFTGRLLQYSSKKFTREAVNNLSDTFCLNFSTYCTADLTVLQCYLLPDFAEQAIELLTSAFLYPSFLQEDFDILLSQTLSAISYSKSDLASLSSFAFNRQFFGDFKYSKLRSGSEESLSKITLSDVNTFYSEQLRKSDKYMVIAGKYDEHTISKICNKYDDFRKSEPAMIDKLLFTAGSNHLEDIYAINRAGANQVNLKIGFSAPSRNHKLSTAFSLANTCLGAYFGSRLNSRIREELGLTYGIFSSINHYLSASILVINATLNDESLEQVLFEIDNSINDLKQNLIHEDELNLIKNYTTGAFIRSLETPQSIASNFINLRLANLGLEHFNKVLQEIENANAEDIRYAFDTLLDTDTRLIALSGDTSKLKANISKYNVIECNYSGYNVGSEKFKLFIICVNQEFNYCILI